MKKIISLFLALLLLSSCGMQSIPKGLNEVDAAWAEVQNQYQRRMDLIPNLVSTVKGYAAHEKSTLEGVVNARAKATSVNVDASNLNANSINAFSKAQGALTSALSKLMVVVEKYPDLKADSRFGDLQTQLEGTENRITVARNRYIKSIKQFNNLVSVPPTSWYNSMFLKHDKKPQFTVDNIESAKKAPKVDF